jgi:hypothetical protein
MGRRPSFCPLKRQNQRLNPPPGDKRGGGLDWPCTPDALRKPERTKIHAFRHATQWSRCLPSPTASKLSAASNVGPADSTRVRFLGGLTVDGGRGTNTDNDYLTEHDITGTPTITTFTAITAP